jgi:hypothetical protein
LNGRASELKTHDCWVKKYSQDLGERNKKWFQMKYYRKFISIIKNEKNQLNLYLHEDPMTKEKARAWKLATKISYYYNDDENEDSKMATKLSRWLKKKQLKIIHVYLTLIYQQADVQCRWENRQLVKLTCIICYYFSKSKQYKI